MHFYYNISYIELSFNIGLRKSQVAGWILSTYMRTIRSIAHEHEESLLRLHIVAISLLALVTSSHSTSLLSKLHKAVLNKHSCSLVLYVTLGLVYTCRALYHSQL